MEIKTLVMTKRIVYLSSIYQKQVKWIKIRQVNRALYLTQVCSRFRILMKRPSKLGTITFLFHITMFCRGKLVQRITVRSNNQSPNFLIQIRFRLWRVAFKCCSRRITSCRNLSQIKLSWVIRGTSPLSWKLRRKWIHYNNLRNTRHSNRGIRVTF